ncbi:MAG: isocitrate/isopropylmalate dehydrogenase family protein [bacterium]
MAYRITLIPGDGTGPELIQATKRVLEATGVAFDWDIQEAGLTAIEKFGNPLPASVLNSIRTNKLALKGPITTPIGTGFRSVNVSMRQALDLYACVRPCKIYPGVRSYSTNIDIIVIRENTEDLYAGIEFDLNSPEADQIIRMAKGKIRHDSAISIKSISVTGTTRIVEFAFNYAVKHNRKKITAVTKANIMKSTDGLFYKTAREVAKSYAHKVDYEEVLVDNLCMQLVQRPEFYDILVMPNLYGDIISDLCAGLIGGLGMAPGANFGSDIALFEATHGSSPQYAGLNKFNPTALILSGMMMLQHLGETKAAVRLEHAVAAVIAEGKSVTCDMKADWNDPTAVGTDQFANAIIAKLRKD